MRIIAIPRNGIGNRLQMLASSYKLAKDLDAELVVAWSEQTVLKASFTDIFEEIPKATVLNYGELEQFSEINLPKFTHFDKRKNRITMKNLRLGDQFFVRDLEKFLETSNEDTEIWIESGEKFSLNEQPNFRDSSEFRAARLDFYNKIKFNKKIIEKYNSISKNTGSKYWAIHIRGTDRISETISNSKIIKEVIRRETDLRLQSSTVFIASDDSKRGAELAHSLTLEGYQVIFDPEKNRNRLTGEEVPESVTDWIALKNASTVVSFGGTTYSYEACVAGNTFDSRIHLKSSDYRQIINRLQTELLFLKLYSKLPYSHSFISR